MKVRRHNRVRGSKWQPNRGGDEEKRTKSEKLWLGDREAIKREHSEMEGMQVRVAGEKKG